MSRCNGFLLAASLVLVSLLAGPTGAAGTAGTASSYSWETREALGDTAVALQITGPSGTNCSVTVELAGWMEDHGVVERIYLWEWANGESDWFHGSRGDDVHAFVAPVVDTRGSPLQELYTSTTTISLPVRGGVTFTVAAPGLEPWPDGFDDGEISLGIDLSCSQVVSVWLSGGREVQILTTRNAETGAGVWSPVANAGAGNLAMGSYTADDVRLRAGTDGLQSGILSVLGGGMMDAWPLLPGSKETLAADGGPGDYILALNRAGGLEDGFWSVLMGLQPVDDLDEIATLPSL